MKIVEKTSIHSHEEFTPKLRARVIVIGLFRVYPNEVAQCDCSVIHDDNQLDATTGPFRAFRFAWAGVD